MSTVAELEQQKEDFKKQIQLAEIAVRLSSNHDFRRLILEEFCVNDCARSVHLSGDVRLRPEDRADALAVAQAGGHVKRYLDAVIRMGAHAQAQINDLDNQIVEAREEENAD